MHRDLFAQLGAFARSFNAEAASAVSVMKRPPEEVLDHLASLSERSLVEVTPGSRPRWRLFGRSETTRWTRLAEAGLLETLHERHLHHYLALALRVRPRTSVPVRNAPLDELEAELANIRAALDWSQSRAEASPARLEEGLRLATAVAQVWTLASFAEGAFYLERLLAIDSRKRVATAPARSWTLLEACRLECFRGNYARTVVLAKVALAMCQALGNLAGAAWAHR